MSQITDYLRRLDEALTAVPHGVATEIRAGIAESLEGLPPREAAERIAQLGDPELIARGAAEEVTPVAAPVPSTHTRGYGILAGLVLAFGSIIVPIVGWIIGAALVSYGGLWKRWEKVTAVIVPLTASAVIALSLFPMHAVSGGTAVTGSGPSNPLLPTAYDMAWGTVALLCIVLIPASGLWLIWRLRGRSEQ